MTNQKILFLSTLLAATLFTSGPLFAAVKQSAQNDKILKATDPYESLAEAALDGSAGKIAKDVKSAQSQRNAARALLPQQNVPRFDELFTLLSTAQAKHDNIGVSLAAAEIYKVLILSLDPSALVVPMEVGLLDYSGFRTQALLKAPNPDWAALADTAHEANGYWMKIQGRVTDAKLRARMDKAQQGMTDAAEKHDAALSHASAKDNLDIVDDLESHFEHK